jgi:hypothetical protein
MEETKKIPFDKTIELEKLNTVKELYNGSRFRLNSPFFVSMVVAVLVLYIGGTIGQ